MYKCKSNVCNFILTRYASLLIFLVLASVNHSCFGNYTLSIEELANNQLSINLKQAGGPSVFSKTLASFPNVNESYRSDKFSISFSRNALGALEIRNQDLELQDLKINAQNSKIILKGGLVSKSVTAHVNSLSFDHLKPKSQYDQVTNFFFDQFTAKQTDLNFMDKGITLSCNKINMRTCNTHSDNARLKLEDNTPGDAPGDALDLGQFSLKKGGDFFVTQRKNIENFIQLLQQTNKQNPYFISVNDTKISGSSPYSSLETKDAINKGNTLSHQQLTAWLGSNSYQDLKGYGLAPEKHTLHMISMGIGQGHFKNVSENDFRNFVLLCARKYNDQFANIFDFHDTLYSPLAAIFGPCCLDSTWTTKQNNHAKIVFNIYKIYKPLVPKQFASMTGSLLTKILGMYDGTYPEVRYFEEQYKQYFEQHAKGSTDEILLKYAVVFFQMKYPNHPLLSEIHPSKFDAAPYFEKLKAKILDHPYQKLQSFLNRKDNWRLFVRFAEQKEGVTVKDYEKKEPGMKEPFLNAFRHLIKTKKQKISREYLENLWKIVTAHRTDIEEKDRGDRRFGLYTKNITLAFMLECNKRYGNFSKFSFTATNSKLRPRVNMKDISELDVNQYYDKFIQIYNTVMDVQHSTFEQKVVATLQLGLSLHTLHKHPDANTRAYITLTIIKALMDLGLPPMVFENPRALNGRMPAEALPLLLIGIENFEEITSLQATNQNSPSVQNLFDRGSKKLLAVDAYELDRDTHYLHMVSMGIGHGFYQNVPDEDFQSFVQKCAQTHKNNFDKKFKFGNDLYSPLSAIFGPQCLGRSPWNTEQINQAKIVFNIYINYEPLLPEKFTARTGSFIHTVLGHDLQTYPEVRFFQDYYKQLFERSVASSKDKDFLKYAVVFFHMKDPNNPQLSKIQPLRKFDTTPYIKKLTEKILKDPYQKLQTLLESNDGWRICMDFGKQRKGEFWLDYETTEQDTIPSLRDGFTHILNSKDVPISRDYIDGLWKIATQHMVFHDHYKRAGSFAVNPEEMTLTFMLECNQKYGHVSQLGYVACGNTTFRPQMCTKHGDNVDTSIEEFVAVYNNADKNPSFEQQVLSALELSHSMVITHENQDGHTRSYTTLLLNRTLMALGLPPMAFENPNSFDGRTAKESLPLVLKGIKNFEAILEGKLPDNMKTTDELLLLGDKRQDKIQFKPGKTEVK